MKSTALVSFDVQTVGGRAGGVGAFVTHLARLLVAHGDAVTILLVTGSVEPPRLDEAWKQRYAEWGIRVLVVENEGQPPGAWREVWPARLSARVAPLLQGFDVVYLQDWANAGFQAIRQARFHRRKRPVFVTVLHGPSQWIRDGNRRLPNVPEDIEIEYIERYGAENSDFVIAPSAYLLDWLLTRGWSFPRTPQVLGLPYLSAGERQVPDRSPRLTSIILFGRLEVRKGFDLFADALALLSAERATALSAIDEIILLGAEVEAGSAMMLRERLQTFAARIRHIADLDSEGAIHFLATAVDHALVVIASPFENFPYAVIETLCVAGLNVIASNGGGIPEVFHRPDKDQLFAPDAAALADKIVERLHRPLQPSELAIYDYQSANQRWIAFHEQMTGPPRLVHAPREPPSVDVCITYFNKGPYLESALQALDAQTHQRFGVIVIDDGSTDPNSRTAFDAAAERWTPHGWKFVRQENAFVDAARNAAAKLSSAEFLLFLDADDYLAPRAIERLIAAIEISGVDCLLSGGLLLIDGQEASAAIPVMPLGPDLLAGLVDPMVFGLPMILIRRRAFEHIGGYREVRAAGHEDWELQVRLLRAGYRADVLPEHLLYFRRTSSGISQTGNAFLARQRMLDSYSAGMPAGLQGMPGILWDLNQECRRLEERLRANLPVELRLRLSDRQKHARE